MAAIIVWITMISLSIQISVLESSGIPASSQFVLYQHRVEILYTRMKAEGCSLPGDVVKRHVLSETADDRLEVEKALYEKLYGVLVSCRKTKLRPTQKPTSTSKTPPSTTSTQTTTSTTTASTTTTAALKCPKDYILNPVSSTCLRLVACNQNWTAAKSTCESAGEYLAVFETQESVRWLYSFLKDSKTPAAWKGHSMFIGLRYTDGAWRWAGRLTTVLSDDDTVWDGQLPNQNTVSTHPCGCVSVRVNWNGLGHCSLGPSDSEDVTYSICEERNK